MKFVIEFIKRVLLFTFTLSFCSSFLFSLEINDSFRLDGYANITALSTSNENADSFTINGGVQGRYQVSENVSFTGHVYLEESNDVNNSNNYEEDIKWLYADYYIGNEIILRAGKFQFPIFTSAEIGSIGYSRTWSENPISTYGAFGYDNFTGAEVLKNFSNDSYDFLLQLSYGKTKNELPSLDGRVQINGSSDSMKGITFKVSNDYIMLNLGYIKALTQLDINEDDIDFDMFAIETQADLYDVTFKAGYIKAEIDSIFPNEQRLYTSLEYLFDDFTPYIYYSSEKLKFKENTNNAKSEIRKNYSSGVRYDFTKNIAFKLSYTYSENIKRNTNFSEVIKDNIIKGTMNVLF